MNELLQKLGVPSELQAFFNVRDLAFDYGDDIEYFAEGLHKVPTTKNIWLAGKSLTKEVILSYSAMELIAFLTLHYRRYQNLDNLSCISVGNRPAIEQLQWIKKHFNKRKFTLVFGNDLLGVLTDIKVAAGLRNKTVNILYCADKIRIDCRGKIIDFVPEKLSLNAFELAFALRSGIRTRKPIKYLTFLDELKSDGKQ